MRLAALSLLLVLGCKSHDEGVKGTVAPPPAGSAAAVRAANQPARRGSLRRPEIAFFAVIAPAGTKPEVLEEAGRTAGTKAGFTITTTGKRPPGKLLVLDRTSPDELGWKREDRTTFGTLVPPDAYPAIDAATFALGIVGETTTREPTLVKQTSEVARAVAEACHGWIVDLDTHRLLPTDRLADYVPGTTIDARKAIALHGVAGESALGLVDSDGMHRLGLPELLVPDIPQARVSDVATVVNATAQTLIDRGDLPRDGELDVDLAKLAGDWHRDEILKLGGTGTITWRVRWVADAHGSSKDPDDLMLELTVAGAEPGNPVALVGALEKYLGAPEDKATTVSFQPELEAAAVKARAALTALRPHFAKGVPPDEQLGVKAPFATDDGGTEWMWVDVIAFKGDTLDGTLDNDPNSVRALKIGARVKVKLDKIADFIHVHADKTKAGGFSLDVMRAHGVDVPPL
jgi:uncharacterized protein YegJ (DUF2314 family)